MANGMEEMGQAELVHISKSTYLRSKDDPELRFQERGKIMVHGAGSVVLNFHPDFAA